MVRYAVLCVLLLTAAETGACAQAMGDRPVDPPAATIDPPADARAEAVPEATGSPSNANATVSPSTVADAMTRPDDIERSRVAADGEPRSGLDLSLGTSLAHGDFGSGQSVRLWTTALGLRYTAGTLRFTGSLPYMRIRGRGLVYSGIDSTPIIVAAGIPGPRSTNKGIGDATLGVSYTLPTRDGAPEIELSGRVKLPIASRSSQLSTRKTDFSAGVQLTKPIGRVAPFVSATYRVFGDPRIINLRNGFAASAGTSVTIGDRSVLLASYHYARAASRLVRDSHELFAGGSTTFPNSRLRATAFATAGLSKGAAAASAGLSLAFAF